MLLTLAKQLPGILLGGIIAAAALIVYNAAIENPGIRRDEEARITSAARARALALIEKRSEDNAEISDLDMAGLCAELGGRWVPNESRCD